MRAVSKTLNELDVVFMSDQELSYMLVQCAPPVSVPYFVVKEAVSRESYRANHMLGSKDWFYPEALANDIIKAGQEIGLPIRFLASKDFGAYYRGIWRRGICVGNQV